MNSNHLKYHSIYNHFLTKSIEFAKKYYGELFEQTSWAVTEKIDGANISFLIRPKTKIKHFSRNQEIVGNSFMNSEEIIKETDENLQRAQEFCNNSDISLRLFGELFGPGIQKNVNYGDKKQIMFFDILENDKYVKQIINGFMMIYLGLDKYFVKVLNLFDTLEEALEYDTRFNSTYNNIEDNLCEGVVIKPWHQVLIDNNGVPFYLKKKNTEFLEKKQKQRKPRKQVDPKVHEWHETFLQYITKQRMESVFSKEGRIESIKELGKYIPLIMLDASDDFYKEEEFPVNDFEKNEQKYIFNCSKEIVELLKDEL